MTARKIPAYDLVSRSELSSQPVQNGTKHPSPDPKILCPTLNVHLLLLFALGPNENRETDVKKIELALRLVKEPKMKMMCLLWLFGEWRILLHGSPTITAYEGENPDFSYLGKIVE